ncbi:MAG: acetyl-CoA synthase subunit gamma [Planctomycetes bacterium]|nr:acetyl-CoA synthase subunit gamma [Planctomycetota bacterium]
MTNDGLQNIGGTLPYSFNTIEYPKVPAQLDWADRFGSWRCRWGVDRMRYLVSPGIYAVGQPVAESPVFVSANYKMSFDRLRMELAGIDAWIMVIDTKGINVWCAAGKGTFGTDEIVRCVEEFKLADIVSHKSFIIPQLGAPGVSAHAVKTQCGFKVVYGPVRAADIPAFMAAGMAADAEMRRVRFPLADRVVLIPMDILMLAKPVVFIVMFFLLAGGFHKRGFSVSNCLHTGCASAGLFLLVYIAGGILGPVLLPILPGRAFSVKGVWVGLAVLLAGYLLGFRQLAGGFSLASWALIMPVVSSVIVMNFTGTSTYTSLSGVMREMRIAVPLQIVGAVIGIGLWITSLFV